ncbi:hypothetical protein DNTS_020897 [Danionella cerebrum]|uniref:Uncharacterized protein n=1 Tax=Danionella cerebrum TaxID=2873325 RepID=A0A553MQ78_9TELE|nr:hypothetical protein DNTS_020897 [Danionella translucida]
MTHTLRATSAPSAWTSRSVPLNLMEKPLSYKFGTLQGKKDFEPSPPVTIEGLTESLWCMMSQIRSRITM